MGTLELGALVFVLVRAASHDASRGEHNRPLRTRATQQEINYFWKCAASWEVFEMMDKAAKMERLNVKAGWYLGSNEGGRSGRPGQNKCALKMHNGKLLISTRRIVSRGGGEIHSAS